MIQPPLSHVMNVPCRCMVTAGGNDRQTRYADSSTSAVLQRRVVTPAVEPGETAVREGPAEQNAVTSSASAKQAWVLHRQSRQCGVPSLA